jgi:hypothetical protein
MLDVTTLARLESDSAAARLEIETDAQPASSGSSTCDRSSGTYAQ